MLYQLKDGSQSGSAAGSHKRAFLSSLLRVLAVVGILSVSLALACSPGKAPTATPSLEATVAARVQAALVQDAMIKTRVAQTLVAPSPEPTSVLSPDDLAGRMYDCLQENREFRESFEDGALVSVSPGKVCLGN